MNLEVQLDEVKIQQVMDDALEKLAAQMVKNQIEHWEFQGKMRRLIDAALAEKLTGIVANATAEVPELEARVRNSLVNKLTNRIVKEACNGN